MGKNRKEMATVARGELVDSPVPSHTHHIHGNPQSEYESDFLSASMSLSKKRSRTHSSSRHIDAHSRNHSTERAKKKRSRKEHSSPVHTTRKDEPYSPRPISPKRRISRSPTPSHTHKSRQRKELSPTRSPSSIRDMPPSPANSRQSVYSRGSPHVSPQRNPLPSQSETMPPPPEDSSMMDSIYRSVLQSKKPQEQDTVSRTMAGSKRRSRQRPGQKTALQPKEVDVQDFIILFDERIRTSDVVLETVNMIVNSHTRANSQIKENLIMDAIRYITFYPASNIAYPLGSHALDASYPKIKDGSYLFSKETFDFIDGPGTLFEALDPGIRKTGNCLDLVFRKSLRGLVQDVHLFDQFADSSLENPIFISARHLELTLLKKIRAHYLKTVDDDILTYFGRLYPRENSELAELVKGCKCEMYLRRLFDKYGSSIDSFNMALQENLGIRQMKVWTNRSAQTETNIMILNQANTVYRAMKIDWSSIEDVSVEKKMVIRFSEEYCKRLKPFIQKYK